MRHHEDAVLGELGEAFRLEGVDQHHGGLLHARGVREHAARGDEQVELHVVDDRLPAADCEKVSPIVRCCCTPLSVVANALCWMYASRRASRETACSKISASSVCGIVVGPDHLVLDPIPQLAFVHVDMDPAQHVRHPGFGTDVRDRVAHPEIRAHRAIEDRLPVRPAEDAEHVGRRPADVDADAVDAASLAICWRMSPTAPGVGMIGASAHSISLS